MDIDTLIQDYGYAAVFFASMMEGEMVQLSGGIAVRAGLLQWPWVVLVGALGTFLATQVWFLGGKYASDRVLKARPTLAPRVERARALLDRYGILLFVFYRFLYGLRTVVPLAIGMSGVSTARFMVIDALSWLVWFTAMSVLGYLLGEQAIAAFQWASSSPYTLLGMLSVLALGGLVLWARGRRSAATSG